MKWEQFVHALFDWCVRILISGGHILGISYEEINIWIFCIIGPIAFVLMFTAIMWQWLLIRKLKRSSI